MYKSFYQLKTNPFESTPDPAFLVPISQHEKGLSALFQSVSRRKGLMVMTGEVGTGKTLVVRCLLQLLDRAGIKYAYVFHSRLSAIELLQYVADDFGLPAKAKSKGELISMLLAFLVDVHRRGTTTVLVVDEAQNLSDEVLEEVRLLCNLETNTEKLIQVVLVGQPELDTKLDSFNLRQVKQRIALRATLERLNISDTKAYVARRLELGGRSSASESLFVDDTLVAIHRWSAGIPRIINALCENALAQAFAQSATTILPATIDEVARDLRLNVQCSAERLRERDTANEVLRAAQTLLRIHQQLKARAGSSYAQRKLDLLSVT
jgi:general secretion pathway protein A